MTPAVEMVGVSHEYCGGGLHRTLQALKDVTFSIGEGEMVGLLGPNGSGKSTLIRVVLGLLRPTSGVVRISGGPPDSLASRMLVGFVPDSPCYHRHLTARELLDFYAQLHGISRHLRRTRVAAVLEETGIGHAADRRIAGFSKGMLQRLGFAQAILHEPRMLILDEPGNGLDQDGIDLVGGMLAGFRARGITVLVASHQISLMESACDRVVFLVDGRLVHIETLAETRNGLGGEAVGAQRSVVELRGEPGLLGVYRAVVKSARGGRRAA